MSLLTQLMLCSSRYAGLSTLCGAIGRGQQQPGHLTLTAATGGSSVKSKRLACIDSWPRVCVVLPFLETCSQDSSNSAP